MTLIRRIHNLMLGLLQIALAVLLVTEPELGYPVIILILSLTLIGTGLHDALYYVSMAKNMVGGKIILYQGVILFDLGLFTPVNFRCTENLCDPLCAGHPCGRRRNRRDEVHGG